MGKSVKIYFSTDDLDPTDPLLHPKEEYHASYLPTPQKITKNREPSKVSTY
jgi:hypothetical protein